ncbi:MAG: GNAT family N-acetyltransferase [Deltaproteobacteria bacterium]|nr:GNAT family N-acetyltransferase [Deltaproteobacteria bacterium]
MGKRKISGKRGFSFENMKETKLKKGVRLVALVPIQPKHFAILYSWRLEPNTARHNPTANLTLAQYKTRLSKVSSNLKERGKWDFRWMSEIGGVAVGSVSLDVNLQQNYGELGYLVSQKHQGRGIGGKMVPLFVDKVFRESKLDRIVATVSEKNAASRAILERIGSVQEGVLRNHFLIQGKRVNQIFYGLLRSEWRPPGCIGWLTSGF